MYKCTAASLGTDKLKKMMKQVKMIKLVIMRLRSLSGSHNYGQPWTATILCSDFDREGKNILENFLFSPNIYDNV